jgi:SAM-dependent methyltransferase
MLLADRVGPTGRVFANEIDLGKLEHIRDRSAERPNATITPILGAEHDPLLPAGETDVAVMVEVFHHLKDKARFLAATRSRLKPGGRLIVVEPDVRQPGGEPDGCYSHPFESRTLAERAGYRFERFDWFKVERLEMFVLVLTVPPRG